MEHLYQIPIQAKHLDHYKCISQVWGPCENAVYWICKLFHNQDPLRALSTQVPWPESSTIPHNPHPAPAMKTKITRKWCYIKCASAWKELLHVTKVKFSETPKMINLVKTHVSSFGVINHVSIQIANLIYEKHWNIV